MTNLKLPSLNYPELAELLRNRGSWEVTIGYKTKATLWHTSPGYPEIEVLHHGNEIASIEPYKIWLSNAGWHSATTADRLNRIAKDNGLPIRVTILDGLTTVRDLNLVPLCTLTGRGITYTMNAGIWEREGTES